ncbi:MAG: aminofutalosine synthase MqnE [Nitrospinae bacterium RIFCSPLOWO2_02_39_17]|nr:MAG: aminofutalosine synthase MqnE [Nitrospinae bacterium RIFCSPHIGHO2_02_39_11]OGV98772.1 MAG: aminofutalosine synthase MqnE [Nitrospinae bacterium RIFCSPHIGHO2_12_FULL_39_42]OGW06497.1 MAG: aminofutalosine synthase MqnE [Nitrospinae bacterium RIFCSPLOWO2_02_39_17]OGW09146.1 MAG: aminofutalosine synthase MqnE [Nitrospinae bacterium RIFCSPLOWO2_12_39_15]OGW09324.1 MAG: aminofutalosine synthase MqnE [Nitrospinae bacterium RIFCSPLOWO2_12_FULL_39_93]
MLFTDSKLKKIEDKVINNQRLSFEDGVILFNSPDLLGIGYLANIVRERKNGNSAYFITNRHINHTNICVNRCRFCAFSKDKGEEGAYEMSIDDVVGAVGGHRVSEFHIVGGLHPDFPFQYYIDMLRILHSKYPDVHIQGFTAVEIDYLSGIAGLSIKDTLIKLRGAGLGSLPGGGAEIFAERVRKKICPEKISGREWLNVHMIAHQIGMKSNATMLYGHVETIEERVDHLARLRELQDETGGFMSFIPLAFHPKNTELDSISKTTGNMDLRILSVSRLMLDNFSHVKAFWIMVGPKLAQISLSFGVDDIDGTVIEEKITHSAGAETEQSLTKNELVRMIKEAGRIPVERDTLYNNLLSAYN